MIINFIKALIILTIDFEIKTVYQILTYGDAVLSGGTFLSLDAIVGDELYKKKRKV